MLEFEYSRSALKNGLALQAELGVNPFKFGMIGSSDSHTAIAGTREENYFGKFSGNEPIAGRFKNYVTRSSSGDDSLSSFAYEELASGLAAVWATENTRAALFDALQRKEVYSTTGTRIMVRMFGGWDYSAEDLANPDMARIGYQKGVPMGGELAMPKHDNAPVFMLSASKDSIGANLDRIQIIKGWLDRKGRVQERIHDVALSDERTVDRHGRARRIVDNTVDVENASYSNRIGAAQLAAVWTDPDFDPSQPAFYYARVIEIPTPSWQAYDQAMFGDEMPQSVHKIIQDRAYTSPIWYTP